MMFSIQFKGIFFSKLILVDFYPFLIFYFLKLIILQYFFCGSFIKQPSANNKHKFKEKRKIAIC